MQFIDRDPLYRVIRITGPHHNLLGLQIASDALERAPELEELDRGSRSSVRLDGREIATHVMLGVEDACRELRKTFHVEKIQYVAEDTPPVDVYRMLARRLVHWIDEVRAGNSQSDPSKPRTE
jgi:hypothetical protein